MEPPRRDQVSLRIDPGRIGLQLVAVIVMLTLASSVGQFLKHGLGHDHVFGLVPMFDLDGERNLPAWYSASMLAVCAIVLFVIAHVRRQQGCRFARQWLVLGALFLFASFDETVGVHEQASIVVRQAFGFDGWLYHAWVLPWTVAGTAMMLWLRPFLTHLPAATRTYFLLAAAIFGSGALGVELMEGREAALSGYGTASYAVFVAVEEFCELLGVTVFLSSLLHYAGTLGAISFEVHEPLVALSGAPARATLSPALGLGDGAPQ